MTTVDKDIIDKNKNYEERIDLYFGHGNRMPANLFCPILYRHDDEFIRKDKCNVFRTTN